MKKIDLGQTIGILANVGVVAGIIFLAVELQQNNELLAAQSRAVRIGIRTDFAQAMYSNPDMVRAITRASGGEELSVEDLFRLEWLAKETLDKFAYVYGEYQRGMIDAGDLAPAGWRITFHEDVPGMVDVWDRDKSIYRPEFVEYIEETVLNR